MNVVKEFKELLVAILDRNPFYYRIIKSLRVIFVNTYERIASVDNKFRLYLTRKFFELNEISRLKVLEHEILHLIFKHPMRIDKLSNLYNVDRKIINLIADAIINYKISLDIVRDVNGRSYKPINFNILVKMFKQLKRYKNHLYKMCLEEIVQKIQSDFEIYSTGEEVEQPEESKLSIRSDLQKYLDLNEIHEESLPNKIVLQEGSLGNDEEEMEENFNTIVKESLSFLDDKVLALEIEEMYRKGLDWKSYLKYFVHSTLRPYARLATWSKLNRILPWIVPGKRSFEKKNVLVGIDSSASISDYDLKIFIKQLYDIIRYSTIILYYWDTDVYGPMILKNYMDVKQKAEKVKGRGGTRITPFLNVAKRHDFECMIIMSDCLWEERDDVVESLLPNKSVLILTLKRVPEIRRGNVKIIKI